MGLDPSKHLGKGIAFLQPYLNKLEELYGINVCGEGGEYETLILDCLSLLFHSSGWGASSLGFSFGNLGSSDHTNQNCQVRKSFLFEVPGDHPQGCDAACEADAEVENAVELADHMIALVLNQRNRCSSYIIIS